MSKELFNYDQKIRKQYKIDMVCGVDETGRGPWSGPIVSAAVILKSDIIIQGLNDSKKLSEKTRIAIEKDIKDNAICWGIAEISPEDIDKKGLTWANEMVMYRAAKNAAESIGLTLEDIKLFIIDQSPCKKLQPQVMMPKADSTSACVAAASVLAKTYRDDFMLKIGNEFPNYNWKQNKGYPTKQHREVIQEIGITPHHRRSFKLFDEQLRLKF